MTDAIKFERLLVLAPHTDDGEIGAGGLISKLNRAGIEKKYVAFSTCTESVPAGYPDNILAEEVRDATKCLGFTNEQLEVLDYPVRNFPQFRQSILEKMVELKKVYTPDLVLIPATFDIHQDHQVVCQEAVRAFKGCTLLGYELPWNCIELRSNLVVELSVEDLQNKLRAVTCYKSQAFRGYGNGDFLSTLAMFRGGQIGVERAESFEVIRWIWRVE